MSQPTLTTERLVLRPMIASDALALRTLASDPAVAATTFVPHPYPDGLAEKWIASHPEVWTKGDGVVLGIFEKRSEAFIGVIELIKGRFEKAELSYWIGVPYWNQGYCTEAARIMIRFGFETMGLNKICSRHMPSNFSSGRVMQKLGMIREGVLRQEARKNGQYFDLIAYGILKSDRIGTG